MQRRSLNVSVALLLAAALCLPALPALAADEAPDALIKRLSTEVLDSIKADKMIQNGDVSRIVALVDADNAIVDLGGVRKQVSITLVPEVAVGDYVIVHVGYAIGTLDEAEAQATLALFGELAGSAR